MTSKLIFLFLALLLSSAGCSQDLNFSFENRDIKPWFLIGEHDKYETKIDPIIFFKGKQSLRIQNSKPSNSFGGVMLFLPNNIKGDSIEFSAWVKLEGVDEASSLGFMLRIDPEIYFNNFQQHHVHGTSDWKKYSIKTKLHPDRTTAIALGIFLSGAGKIWADDVRVLVDGKDINANSSIVTVPFARNHPTIETSGVEEFRTSTNINARLADLAKIWGALKYRHPEVAKGNIDWDLQLFKSINTIVHAEKEEAVEDHYRTLIDSLGPIASTPYTPTADLKQAISYEWIEKLPFGATLLTDLRNLRYSSFKTHHYYGFNDGVGNVRITNESDYRHIEDPDVGFRLLSLFRFWNIVQYFSPYKYLIDKPWEEVLEEYIPKMIASQGALAYQQTVTAMLNEVKDAHTQLCGTPQALSAVYGDRALPAVLKFAEEKPVVMQLAKIDDQAVHLQVGDIILRKDGKNIQEIRDSLYPFISTPNVAVAERELAAKLARSRNDHIHLEIDRNGKIHRLDIPAVKITDLKFDQDSTAIKILPGNILYINHGHIKKSDIDLYARRLNEFKGVIIDIRNYPRDFLVFHLTPLLLPEAREFVKFTQTGYNDLGNFVFTPPLKVGRENSQYYRGKIALLVNEMTQSSAEYHTMAYRTAPLAKVFGSQTAGADGNVSDFYLPGGLYSMITGIGVYYPDGSETQRIGIIPDVEIKPTVTGIREGRDEVLEKALEYVNQK